MHVSPCYAAYNSIYSSYVIYVNLSVKYYLFIYGLIYMETTWIYSIYNISCSFNSDSPAFTV
jgi:hypothetical protein